MWGDDEVLCFSFRDDNCSLTLDASQMPVTSDQPCEGTIVHIEEGNKFPENPPMFYFSGFLH